MKYPHHAQALAAMQQADLRLRRELLNQSTFHDGYHPAMEALHLAHAERLQAIMLQIGYPTPEKVGAEGHQAAWLVIQHAISRPTFMRYAATQLSEAVEAGTGDAQHLAYLQDRIAVLSGAPQRYGTQFDWDADGQLSPLTIDDPAAVDARRKALGLPSLAAQTAHIRAQAAAEGQRPPTDRVAKQQQYDAWRKAVGWLL